MVELSIEALLRIKKSDMPQVAGYVICDGGFKCVHGTDMDPYGLELSHILIGQAALAAKGDLLFDPDLHVVPVTQLADSSAVFVEDVALKETYQVKDAWCIKPFHGLAA